MKLKNAELHKALSSKRVTHLFHSNTVATSTSFILAGGLMSRGDVERNNLFQTPQYSDESDKKFDVWSDVFLDSEDLHKKFGRQNKYGPVSFRFNVNFLLEDDLDVWVTKDNPANWREGQKPTDQYFSSVCELMRAWGDPDPQRRMLTIRKPERPVLFDYLDAIVVDYFNGGVFAGQDLIAGEVAENALFEAIEERGLPRSLIKRRDCEGRCYCVINYRNELSNEDRARIFLPR